MPNWRALRMGSRGRGFAPRRGGPLLLETNEDGAHRPPVAGARAPEDPRGSPTGVKPRALIVGRCDHDRLLRKVELELLGFNVLEAGNYPEAVAVLDAAAPLTLMVMDLDLNERDGHILAELIASRGAGPCVLFTSRRARTMRAYAGGWLVPKPALSASLAAALARLCA